MAVFEFRKRLNQRPQAFLDGSGDVGHDLEMIYREVGSGLDWDSAPVVPSHHRSGFPIPAADLLAILENEQLTPAQRAVQYRDLVNMALENPFTHEPLTLDWTDATTNIFLSQNAVAQSAVAAAAELIEVDLGRTYPVVFN